MSPGQVQAAVCLLSRHGIRTSDAEPNDGAGRQCFGGRISDLHAPSVRYAGRGREIAIACI